MDQASEGTHLGKGIKYWWFLKKDDAGIVKWEELSESLPPPQKKTKTKEKVQEGLFSENNQEETENTVAG